MLVVAIEHMRSGCFGITKKADLESAKNRPKMGIYSMFDGLAGLRHSMGKHLPGYPQVIPVRSRVPAYIIPAGSTTRGYG